MCTPSGVDSDRTPISTPPTLNRHVQSEGSNLIYTYSSVLSDISSNHTSGQLEGGECLHVHGSHSTSTSSNVKSPSSNVSLNVSSSSLTSDLPSVVSHTPSMPSESILTSNKKSRPNQKCVIEQEGSKKKKIVSFNSKQVGSGGEEETDNDIHPRINVGCSAPKEDGNTECVDERIQDNQTWCVCMCVCVCVCSCVRAFVCSQKCLLSSLCIL